ncbi:glycoside hydrolase family 31 protein [Sphaerobolus stellatus SS14]|nr:glycoside hydrolase family 31 protein [Sphaerobolus stellatus SS14]
MRIGALLLSSFILPLVFAVKEEDFKKCNDSGFCRRGRALSARANESGASWKSSYVVDPNSIVTDTGSFTAGVKSSLYPDIKFSLEVRVHEDGVTRVRMDEVGGLRKRYDEAASWALIAEPRLGHVEWTKSKKDIRAQFGAKKDLELRVIFEPLKISLLRNGKEEIVLNGGGLLHMEHFRVKEETPQIENNSEDAGEQAQQVLQQVNPRAWFEGDNEDGWWSEQFKSWNDLKPKGPESLSLDVSFPYHGHVYGIPEHATRMDLPTTTGPNAVYSEPYRLYNLDVFEYLANSPMSLYGAVPLLHAHSASSTVGFLDLVASETWIDVSHPTDKSTNTHWVSESGILDVFLLPGPTPDAVFEQYARLTGPSYMPPEWSLGYHQCRWNYISSTDVRSVANRFDEEDIPFDVIWLDIEYAEDHKYFMWKGKEFPDPVQMINDIAAVGRKMVAIVDPHVKRVQDYPVYKKASELDILIKAVGGGGELEGWCWPGSSSWVDFFNPTSWNWWISLFKIKSDSPDFHWEASTEDIHIWNDMNEPSVFNGPEITMEKGAIHYGGWEHRDVHNINGMLFQNLTSQAITARSNGLQRPFVLSRAFYAGSQRFGAIWTGDNLGTWEHMEIGVPMVLSNGLAGMTFSGADVGGFFGNPDPEMLVRWYQVGAFAPFFRAHGHIDTKRREPYLLDEPYKSMVRNTLRLRYSLLPVWYTAFREASVRGIPILRPQYVVFPKDKAGFSIDDQYYIGGSGLLVKPITQRDVNEAQVYLADAQPYYNYYTYHVYHGSAGRHVTVAAALDEVPLLIRGGSIVPTRDRPRRATRLMKKDPFTLHIALDKTGAAQGELYLDDGETYAHQKGNYIWRKFAATSLDKSSRRLQISSTNLATQVPTDAAVYGSEVAVYQPSNEYTKSIERVRVERIVILGLPKKPSQVKLNDGKDLQWTYEEGVSSSGKKDGLGSVLIIKDPRVSIINDWSIRLS